VIANQSEASALRIDGGFVMDRAILETKYEPAGDPIAVCGLYQIAIRQWRSIECPQNEEAVDQALDMSDRHCLAS
jgi:hypothetical protein